MTAYREDAVTFGPGRSLVGVLTTPVAGAPNATVPAVVILNAGVIHRVGANRVHVRMAREIASRGFVVLRFDLSGIGDSDPRAEAIELDEAVRRDVADALSHLESDHGARSFVLFGLCSGANNGFAFAVSDPRVVGAVLIDPVAFRTLRFYVTHYVPRLLRLRTWINVFTGRNPRIRQLRDKLAGRAPQQRAEAMLNIAAPPTRRDVDRGLATLLGRGAELLLIFTGGLRWQYNYASQFSDTFPQHSKSERVRVAYFPESDHTFSEERPKAELMRLVAEWLAMRIETARVPTQLSTSFLMSAGMLV